MFLRKVLWLCSGIAEWSSSVYEQSVWGWSHNFLQHWVSMDIIVHGNTFYFLFFCCRIFEPLDFKNSGSLNSTVTTFLSNLSWNLTSPWIIRYTLVGRGKCLCGDQGKWTCREVRCEGRFVFTATAKARLDPWKFWQVLMAICFTLQWSHVIHLQRLWVPLTRNKMPTATGRWLNTSVWMI